MFASLLFAFAMNGSWAAFQDPLDVPAAMTTKAAVQPMVGVAVAGKRIVGVGRRGVILTSDDNGKSWKQSAVPVGTDLTAVSFPTADKGWAVGHGGVVIATTDGGLTWTRVLDGRKVAALLLEYYEKLAAAGNADANRVMPDVKQTAGEGPVHPFLDVWFENDKVGYVSGAFNLLLRTDDGGKNWTPLMDKTENPKTMHLYNIRGAGGEVFACGEQGLLLRLDKATQRFMAVKTPYEGTYFSLAVRPGNLILTALHGTTYHSRDNGKTWSTVNTKLATALSAATFFPDGRAVVVSQGGDVMVSKDGGDTYVRLPTSKPIPLAGVATLGTDAVVTAGMFGLSVEPLAK